MTFLILSSLTLLGIGFMVLRPFVGRARTIQSETGSDLAIYWDQMDEIERDLARGILTDQEADSIRAEVGRRILSTERLQDRSEKSEYRSVVAPLVLALAALAATGGLYASLGTFGALDQPLAARIASLEAVKDSRPSQIEAEVIALAQLPTPPAPSQEHRALIDQLRQVVADRPGDLEGMRLLAGQEASLGNYVEARTLREEVVLLQGDQPKVDDLAQLFNAMIFNTNEYISPEAEEILLRLRAAAPDMILGMLYEGMLNIQSGRPDLAFPLWRHVLENSPPTAPWLDFVRQEMPAIAQTAGVRYTPPANERPRGPTAQDVQAASGLSAEERTAMIEGMVQQLADRLGTDGGPLEEWLQLARALVVLDRKSEAQTVLSEAIMVFAQDARAISEIERFASEVGIAL